MPLTVFDVKGIQDIAENASRRPLSPAANTLARPAKHGLADPFKDGFRFLMTAVIYRRAAACAPLRW
jgi:hypothetical protein